MLWYYYPVNAEIGLIYYQSVAQTKMETINNNKALALLVIGNILLQGLDIAISVFYVLYWDFLVGGSICSTSNNDKK